MKKLIIILGCVLLGAWIVGSLIMGSGSNSLKSQATNIINESNTTITELVK